MRTLFDEVDDWQSNTLITAIVVPHCVSLAGGAPRLRAYYVREASVAKKGVFPAAYKKTA